MSDIEVTLMLTPEDAKELISEQNQKIRTLSKKLDNAKRFSDSLGPILASRDKALDEIADLCNCKERDLEEIVKSVRWQARDLLEYQNHCEDYAYMAETIFTTENGEQKSLRQSGVTMNQAISRLGSTLNDEYYGTEDMTIHVVVYYRFQQVRWTEILLYRGGWICPESREDVDPEEDIKAELKDKLIEALLKNYELTKAIDKIYEACDHPRTLDVESLVGKVKIIYQFCTQSKS